MNWVVLILTLAVVAATMACLAAKRWWEYLIVLVLAALLVVPFCRLTGDVSAVVPVSGDKDEIIWASVAATFLWPLFTSALIVWAVKAFKTKIRNLNEQK